MLATRVRTPRSNSKIRLPNGRAMSALDERIIARIQQGVELCDAPFAALAQDLGLAERELPERLAQLIQMRALSFFGPLYFEEAFGRGLSLVGMSVPGHALDKVVATVADVTEVVNLCTCRNFFNVWFTLSALGPTAKDRARQEIEQRTGYRAYHFYSQGEIHAQGTIEPRLEPASEALSELDWRLIDATEAGLPLTPHPFAELAQQLGVSADEILTRFQRLREKGVLLQIAGVPDYYGLGLKATGLTVWNLSEEACASLAPKIAALPYVGQCTVRPRYLPEWPYNLFVVVHGRTRMDVQSKAQEIVRLLGDAYRQHEVLFRARMLKKTKQWPLKGIG